MIDPYEEYKVYGPYLHTGEGRRMVTLVSATHRTSTSYARYLMSKHLGRLLEKHEIVDHIDNNSLNDSLDNLQIISKQENNSKDRSVNLVTLDCPVCRGQFTRERRQTHLVKGGRETCCSRSCAGKYQHMG